MQVKLTAGFVATAGAPSDGKDRAIYWDEKRPGFGLMVTAAGKRSFVFQFQVHNSFSPGFALPSITERLSYRKPSHKCQHPS